MAEPRALLLDMDGTLVDTAGANYAAYAAALGEVGVTVGRAAFDRIATGRRWTHFLPELLAGSTADPAAVAARKQLLYPGVVAATEPNAALLALARTAKATHRLALVTSASRPSVDAVLTAHGLASLFDTIVSGDDVAEPKPSPEPYRLAATRLGVDPANCLAIEDSDIGIESARRAGMTVLRLEAVSG